VEGTAVQEDLKKLLKGQTKLWRGSDISHQDLQGIGTGFAALDRALPAGGWPADALVEIITRRWGIGELSLLLPAMAELSRQRRWVVWIAPPYQPYAPALIEGGVDLNHCLVVNPEDDAHDTLWSAEKLLRTEPCGMVLAWPKALPGHAVRRLQLAAEAGHSLGILFRTADIPSAAALRIRLQGERRLLRVDILKARGGTHPATVHLRP
jgi:cell division inhibitor SulA/protein ImuA